MSLSPDEQAVRGLLEDLTASQPPPPPGRWSRVRRRAIRRYWHQAVAAGSALAVLTAGVALTGPVRPAPPARPAAARASLPPTVASYLGVFEKGAPPSYQPVAAFARAAGRQPNLVGYFSGWTQPFNITFAQEIFRHGSVPLVQINPTDASVAAIVDGVYDTYLRTYADAVRNFGHPVVLGFGEEANADWYSWGYRHVPAAKFVAAWRHIVTLFRAAGADNVIWLWTIQADTAGTGPISGWWPGARYVTWVGIDGYYAHPTDTFASVFGKTIDQVRQFTGKPVLLSETSVAPAAGQFVKIQDLFQGMAQYKTLGLVWFDLAQGHGIFRDRPIEGDPAAATSLQLGVRDELVRTSVP